HFRGGDERARRPRPGAREHPGRARAAARRTRGLPLLGLVERWAIPLCGSVLAQELIARVLAMRSPEVARRAVFLGGGLYIAVGFIPVFLGLVGAQLLPHPVQPEQLMARVAQEYLPTFLYIAFAGALVSAILSTVDSALLAA